MALNITLIIKKCQILDRPVLWLIPTYRTDMRHVIAAEGAVILLCSDSNPVSFIIHVPLMHYFLSEVVAKEPWTWTKKKEFERQIVNLKQRVKY